MTIILLAVVGILFILLVFKYSPLPHVPLPGFDKTVRIQDLRDTYEATEALVNFLKDGDGPPHVH